MLKQLTLVVCAAALLPACIITTDNGTSNSESNGATETDTTGTASGTTTTGDDGTDSTNDIQTTDTPTTENQTTDAPTTESPTTGMTSEMTSGTTTTTEATTGTTTGGVDPGCGWYATDKYYDCVTEENGIVAGMEDPEMISPIACAKDLVEGDKCDNDNGPVTKVGCCTPEGVLYYCEDEVSNAIVKIDCNMLP